MSYSAVILGLCQFLFMAAVAVGIAFNALVGKVLAPSPLLATFPFLFVMGSTAMLTLLMPALLARFGYKKVFLVGAGVGFLAGLLAAWSIWLHSFTWFCIAGLLMGLYQASAMYYRFAAADAVSAPQKSSAIAWVLTGGVVAALLGPMIGSSSLHLFHVDYLGAYVASGLLALLALPLVFFAPIPERLVAIKNKKIQWSDINNTAITAMLFCISGYVVMAMVMMASPLAMSGCGYHAADAASVIQWHLLGMFAPSLLVGKIIARLGAKPVAFMGIGILALGCLLALWGQTLPFFHVALLIIGVGWNFMYMGGSTILTQITDTAQRSRVQAMNEFITFSCVTLIAAVTGILFETLGWQSILYVALGLLLILVSTFFYGALETGVR